MKFVIAIVVLALTLGSVEAATPKVSASLVTDATMLQSGQPLTVAVRLKLAPKFHVYWLNPGDSGLATTVKWTLPQGVTASPLQFPAPHRIALSGGIVNYGYEDEVLLLTTLQVSSEAREPLEISADVNWLVCDEDSCTPGSAKGLKIKLPAQTSADATLIESWKKQLLIPADKSPEVKQLAFKNNISTIQWADSVKDIHLFPPADKFWSIGESTIVTDGQTTTVRYQFNSQHPKDAQPTSTKPVIGYTLPSGEPRAIELPAVSKP